MALTIADIQCYGNHNNITKDINFNKKISIIHQNLFEKNIYIHTWKLKENILNY
jgi:hypothetical protein